MAQIITSNSWWGGWWAWAYTYKWTVNTYEDLPSTWLKIWDVYNVINEHTTDPKFPAWANVAWTGTGWDVLGWTFDLSIYQKKLVEWSGIDIDQTTNEISVESTVIQWASKWATAIQPNDNVSELANDAWYIDKDVNNLTNYTKTSDLPDFTTYQLKSNLVTNLTSPDDAHYPSAKAVSDAITSSWGWDMLKATYDPNNIWKDAFDYDNFINTPTIPAAQVQSDWDEADNTQVDYIKNKPTIPTVNNSTIEIQKNWTKVKDFTLNQSSWETINITVPTDTSDLTNWAWFVTSSIINDTAYWAGWDADTTHAPTKNAVYDKLNSMDTTISWKANSADLWTAAACNTGTSSWNVPILDSNWKLSQTVLPWVALTDTFTVTNKSDLTSLSSAQQWDIGIVTAESKTYVLSADPYSTAANWKEILAPTGWVTSVNSQTWAVTLDADDISDSTTTNKFVTATDKSTWSGKQDALTLPATPTQWHLVTWWANNKSLTDWWTVPTWFNPWWTATTGYVVTKTANWYEWQAPTGWIQVSPNSTITGIKYIWYGTESDYAGLSQYYTDTPWDTEFHTF